MPDGVNAGDEFEEVCTLKFTDDGKAMLLAIDGNTLDAAAEKERKKTKPMGMRQKMSEMTTDADEDGE